ncbi:MAG: hypothetical protein IH804_04180 [Planctomycetes bacterium]|nr:hypothetical protein [Planctomycetota bacterium]
MRGRSEVDLVVRDLGRMAYAEALELQRRAQRELIESRPQGGGAMTVFLVEHVPPVITLSRRPTAREHLIADAAQIRAAGGEASFVPADVSNAAEVERMDTEVAEVVGAIEVQVALGSCVVQQGLPPVSAEQSVLGGAQAWGWGRLGKLAEPSIIHEVQPPGKTRMETGAWILGRGATAGQRFT